MSKNRKRQADPGNKAPEKGKTIPQTGAPVSEDRIRQRAFEIHQAHGGTPGRELDDWLQAERELKQK
jgi:hypothetical protein